MPITHQREAPKLDFALALALGICIHSHGALPPAISEEKVEIPEKVDFSHSFQWQKSFFSESL